MCLFLCILHPIFVTSSNLSLPYNKSYHSKSSLSPPRKLFSVLFVCLSGLRKNYWPDFHEILQQDVACAREELIKFWSGSESQGRYVCYFSGLPQ